MGEYACVVAAGAAMVIAAVGGWCVWRTSHRRPCAGCGRRTVPVPHGYSPDGKLLWGPCPCGGWRCRACGHLNGASGMCIR